MSDSIVADAPATPQPEIGRPVRVMGIDPGVNGAIAVLSADDLHVIDVPTVKCTGKRSAVDRYELARIIDRIASDGRIDHAFIEHVSSRPTDGHVGAFMFGRAYEALCMAVASAFIPITEVSPAKWRNALGISRPEKAGDKSHVIARANTMFPAYAHLWRAKSHADRAEASLIAEHGRRVLAGASR